ncbi:hypothetical protein [Streptomyces sp. NPDC020747]|uniref:hypothetical protein n=1 Tax=Streptomyces sp. NPDC020747 TaxID=3365086 RepID=UPI00379EED93
MTGGIFAFSPSLPHAETGLSGAAIAGIAEAVSAKTADEAITMRLVRNRARLRGVLLVREYMLP